MQAQNRFEVQIELQRADPFFILYCVNNKERGGSN